MSETLKFKVFCIESFKNKYSMTGTEVSLLFKKYDVLKYIEMFFEELHSYGDKFIVEDLTLYLNARGYFLNN